MTNLKMIREEKGLSQSQLARATGISLRTLQHYEQGSKKINNASITTCLALAECLGVDVRELLE